MIPKPVNFRTELRPLAVRGGEDVSGPYHLAGGWQTGEVAVGKWTCRLTIPAIPDALLDDPESVAANVSDDRMPYWAFVWPAALPMAAAVQQSGWQTSLRVLELGCGTGLVGLAALAAGLHVTFTDYEPRAVQLARHNAILNGYSQFAARVLDWRNPESEQFPVILGCDLLYQESAFEPLLNLLEQMLAPGGECWLGDGGRSSAVKFWYLARERGYGVEVRGDDGQALESPAQNFQLFVLRRGTGLGE
jgi:predicted nicotinamide N-methyase